MKFIKFPWSTFHRNDIFVNRSEKKRVFCFSFHNERIRIIIALSTLFCRRIERPKAENGGGTNNPLNGFYFIFLRFAANVLQDKATSIGS